MAIKVLKNVTDKILIIGPLFGNLEKINKINEIASNYQYVIINGNLISENQSEKDLDSFINKISSNTVINFGNNELKIMGYKNINSIINLIIIEFTNKYKVIITNGGIRNNMNLSNIADVLETSFINDNWHDIYNGKLGYVISNNPVLDRAPDFFKFSARIGNVPTSDTVYGQEVDKFGLKRTISL